MPDPSIPHIDEAIALNELDVLKFARIFREATLLHMAETRDALREAAETVTQKFAAEGREVSFPEDFGQLVPPPTEIAAIGREPFCRHGFAPMCRCKVCMTRAVFAATLQRLFKAVYDLDLSDEQADEFAAREDPYE